MKALAIITARGGSKRIPRKNIKEFLGKPIICYSIEAALASGIFDEVMVSTDDDEIASIAKNAGAKVPFMRSKETSNDFATTNAVILEVLKEYQKRGMEFDYVACLYPTNPFITVSKLQKSMEIMLEKKCAEVVPMVSFSYPPQRGYVIDEKGIASYKWPEFKNSRSQDLEKMYHDAGQFYLYDAKSYLEHDGVYGEVCPLICSETEVQDIDTLDDWKLAEIKVEYLRRMGCL